MKTGTEKKVENSWAFRGRVVWLFTKYQLLSKGLLALVIYPLYSLAIDTFLGLSGRTGISSGDYLSFLLSFQGLGFLLATLVLMVVLIGLDINTFILTSALIKEGKIEMTARHMLWLGLTSLKSLYSPAGLLLMVYVSPDFPALRPGCDHRSHEAVSDSQLYHLGHLCQPPLPVPLCRGSLGFDLPELPFSLHLPLCSH